MLPVNFASNDAACSISFLDSQHLLLRPLLLPIEPFVTVTLQEILTSGDGIQSH
jgi:hypothetical protein